LHSDTAQNWYFTEIFASKHPYLLTKKAAQTTAFFIKQEMKSTSSLDGARHLKVLELMVADCGFYLQCMPLL
jgi:hypothetical protein